MMKWKMSFVLNNKDAMDELSYKFLSIQEEREFCVLLYYVQKFAPLSAQKNSKDDRLCGRMAGSWYPVPRLAAKQSH
jgi:hypothetical protein